MAFWSGGDEAALKALLLGRGSIKLFNAALKAVPDSQLPSLLELLPQQPGGAAAAAAATTFGSSGSSGDAVGAESSSSPGARTRGGGPAVLRPNVETAQILLERLPKGELRDELDHWMRVLLGAGLEPDYRVFLPWASYYAQAGSVSGVRSVMEEVEARGGRMAPQYYSQLVRAYCTRGRWKENEALLEEMRGRGIEPTEHIYRALIWCCGRHHRADRAQGVFDEMRARGLEPSVPTWSALLNAYADSRQPHRAVEALQGMRRQGLTPSVQVYGALAKAFAGSGDWRRALQVIERMEGDGVAPNEQVFGSVIEAAAVAGKPSVAAEVLRRMRAAGVQPNVIAYTSLLSSYGATGDVEGAEGVLREMAAAGCSPNQKSYTELMSQLADKGRHEECERYFRQMVADGCPTDGISYAILIDSMLTRWNRDREGQAALLPAVEARFAEAAAGPLGLHTYLHQPQGRMVLDLHGYSTWTAQLAVLATLDDLLHQHRKQGPITDHLSRLDIITGRGNRSVRRHRGKLRELVLEMLQHLLPVTFGRSNDGLLVLEGKALRKLFDAMTQQGRGFSLPEMAHCLVDPGTV